MIPSLHKSPAQNRGKEMEDNIADFLQNWLKYLIRYTTKISKEVQGVGPVGIQKPSTFS